MTTSETVIGGFFFLFFNLKLLDVVEEPSLPKG